MVTSSVSRCPTLPDLYVIAAGSGSGTCWSSSCPVDELLRRLEPADEQSDRSLHLAARRVLLLSRTGPGVSVSSGERLGLPEPGRDRHGDEV